MRKRDERLQGGTVTPEESPRVKDMFFSNPLLVLGLGISGAVAVANSAQEALGFGLFVLLTVACAHLLASLLARILPGGAKAIFMMRLILTAFLASGWGMLLALFPPVLPLLQDELFLPVAFVVAFALLTYEDAQDVGLKESERFVRVLLMTLGYAGAVFFFGVVRELLGRGSFFGQTVFAQAPFALLAQPSGAFLLLGVMMAGCAFMLGRKKEGNDAA